MQRGNLGKCLTKPWTFWWLGAGEVWDGWFLRKPLLGTKGLQRHWLKQASDLGQLPGDSGEENDRVMGEQA